MAHLHNIYSMNEDHMLHKHCMIANKNSLNTMFTILNKPYLPCT